MGYGAAPYGMPPQQGGGMGAPYGQQGMPPMQMQSGAGGAPYNGAGMQTGMPPADSGHHEKVLKNICIAKLTDYRGAAHIFNIYFGSSYRINII